ncbi:MAG: family 43 glycosylhydrolase [Spirochaetes bacterium]|nr:family 43 glycosylhydrolase [Spirochaetota bacterium]
MEIKRPGIRKFIAFFLIFFSLMFYGLQIVAADTYVNPRYVTHDPWIIQKDGYYYYCASDGDTKIYVWKSKSLTEKGDGGPVWTAPSPGPNVLNSNQVWAPELHYINNKWYIYYAASDGDNANHRMWVLEANTSDPQGSYIDKGELDTGGYWAIDGTVLDYNGSLYFIWSGWPGTTNTNVQNTYIATMSGPTAISGSRVLISQADQTWEKLDSPYYFQEGQEVLKNNNGDIFIIYSTNPFWTIDYRLGQLKFTGSLNSQITDPSYWTKKSRPVFQATYDIWGPGHASYVKSNDGTEDYIVYHSQISTTNGKKAHSGVQKFTWNQDGSPNFVQPISGAVPRDLPSGETGNVNGTTFTDDFSDGNAFDGWTFNGSSSTFTVVNGQFKIDGTSEYASGEKALVRGYKWSDFTYTADVKIASGTTWTGGLLFRVKNAGMGRLLFEGYYVGLNPSQNNIIVGRSNGREWTTLKTYSMTVNTDTVYKMKIVTSGPNIKVYVTDMVTPKVDINDSVYYEGELGVRTSNSITYFDNISISDSGNAATYGYGNSALGSDMAGSWTINSATSLSQTALGSGWNRIYFGDVYSENHEIAVDVRWVQTGTTSTHPKYGIYADYIDSNNFISAWLDKKYGVLATYGIVNGSSLGWQNSTLTGFDFSAYHELKVRKEGSTFYFYVDGNLKQTRTFNLNNGQVALATEDTVADYINIKVDNSYGWGDTTSGSASTGSWVLYNSKKASQTLLGTDWTGYDWEGIYRGDVAAVGYTVSADVTWVATGTTSSAPKYGIYGCFKDYNNKVLLFLDKKNNVLATYGKVDGIPQAWQNTNLGTFDFSVSHELKVIKSGTTFYFYLDGSLKQTRTFNISNGQTGLVTVDTKADFNNFAITNVQY